MSSPDGEEVSRWVEAARGGDRAAFGLLVRRFQDAVVAVLLARLGREPDVEDLAQETFLAAYRQLDRLKQPALFGAWVCGIAANLARTWRRRQRPVEPLPPDLPEPTPGRGAALSERVLQAVATLPRRLREPVLLFYISGYTAADVAELMGLPAGTVRRRLHEARNHLREVWDHMDELRHSAPSPDFADEVLDRISVVRVADRTFVNSDSGVVVIVDEAGRAFPIFIGRWEGEALRRALGELPPPERPLLYDALVAARPLGLRVSEVQVTHVESETFIARVAVDGPSGRVWVDSRPSDAINLAVRGRIVMRVARAVTRQQVPDAHNPRPLAEVMARFVNDLDPHLDAARAQVRADPSNGEAGIRLADTLINIVARWAYTWPRPLPPELLAERAREYLAEARGLLRDVLQRQPPPRQRDEAALALAAAECLAADWPAAAAALDGFGGDWRACPWSAPLHAAIAMQRTDRLHEAWERPWQRGCRRCRRFCDARCWREGGDAGAASRFLTPPRHHGLTLAASALSTQLLRPRIRQSWNMTLPSGSISQ